jgi:hypothetical protein
MQIIFDTNSILIMIGMIIMLISNIITIHHIRKMFELYTQHSLIMYRIHRLFDRMYDQSSDIAKETKQLHEGFEILMTDYNSHHQQKHLPDPTQAAQIEATINDLISIEILLSSDMKISRRDSVINIASKTAETYPDIDVTYIVKKTLSVIESFIRNN